MEGILHVSESTYCGSIWFYTLPEVHKKLVPQVRYVVWVWAYAQPASCHCYVGTYFKCIHVGQTKYCLPILQAHRCLLVPCSTVCNEIRLSSTGDEQNCVNNSKCCNFSKSGTLLCLHCDVIGSEVTYKFNLLLSRKIFLDDLLARSIVEENNTNPTTYTTGHIYVCIYAHPCIVTCIHTYINSYINTTYIYIYTHTHIHNVNAYTFIHSFIHSFISSIRLHSNIGFVNQLSILIIYRDVKILVRHFKCMDHII